MKPVTWSRASVSVNDLSLAPSVILVFPGQAIWMRTIHWAAAKVSELWPCAGGKNIMQRRVYCYFLSPLRTHQKGLGTRWRI